MAYLCSLIGNTSVAPKNVCEGKTLAWGPIQGVLGDRWQYYHSLCGFDYRKIEFCVVAPLKIPLSAFVVEI
jgi:hypothetical protein